MFRALTLGVRRLFRPAEAERDLRDEIDQYVRASAEEYRRQGLSPADAERRARADFGGVEATKEAVRESGWDGAVDGVRRDLMFGLRALRRNPGFTAIALATLALGIGANTAMFSVVNAVIFKPLPYRDASRLALIFTNDIQRGLPQQPTAWRTINDWRGASSIQNLSYFAVGRATLSENGERRRSRRAFVSANLFTTLGVIPAAGRAFSPQDEAEAAPVAVISSSLATRRFGSAEAALGKTIDVEDMGRGANGAMTLRVIGVMPEHFYFPDKGTAFWIPATTYWRFQRESSERFPDWARRWTAIVRLAPDRDASQARKELDAIGATLAKTFTPTVPDFPGFATTVVPVLDTVAGQNVQAALWVLLAAVGLVLLVACANVANLLLARGTARQQEFAVRGALGAGRGRIVRQLMVESLALGLAGGVLGLALTVASTRLLGAMAGNFLPRGDELAVDWRVVAFAAGASILCSALFGIAPSLRLTAGDVGAVLNEGGRSAGGRQVRRTRSLLVIAECSLAIILLAGAGLLLRSLSRLHGTDPGFEPRGVLTVRLEFPPTLSLGQAAREAGREPTESQRAGSRARMMQNLLEGVEAIPSVVAAGFTDDMFIAGAADQSIMVPGRDQSVTIGVNEGAMTPGFFRAMRVPLRRGRYLTDDDLRAKIAALWAPSISSGTLAERQQHAVYEPVVVNESFARQLFPNENPVGKQFCVDPTGKTYWYVIVGVVGDLRRQGLDRKAAPEFFGPYLPSGNGRADLMVKVRGDPLAVAANVRQVVSQAVPGTIIGAVATADQQLNGLTAQRDFQTWVLTTFALLAMVLAAVGIFGVVHFSVAERRRELGVRIALGATPVEVMQLVVGQGMVTPLVGIGIGLVVSYASTRLLSRLLFGIEPTDPITFAGVAALLTFVAFAACYFPARRATRVDVVQSLRRE